MWVTRKELQVPSYPVVEGLGPIHLTTIINLYQYMAKYALVTTCILDCLPHHRRKLNTYNTMKMLTYFTKNLLPKILEI